MRMSFSMMLLGLAVGFAHPAIGADAFTISVPVQVSNLHPSINFVMVACRLSGKDPVTQNQRQFGTAKSVNLPVKNGTIATSQAVLIFHTEDFSAADQNNLGSITGGDCNLGLIAADGTIYQPYNNSAGPVLGHKPGTPFQSQINFAIK